VEQGVMVTGEYLSGKSGKSWVGSDGEERHPYLVALLVGDRTLRVEYPSLDVASEWVGAAERGDVVTLPVFLQSPKGTTTVFLRGMRKRS